MVLTWKQYKTLKDALNSGVDDFTALGMIGATEIPIIGPILIASAGGLLKWGLNYIVNNLVPHEFQPTSEIDIGENGWEARLERGEGVPLSPDVDPGSWTREGRMRWQSPENRKKWEDLVNKTKNDTKLKDILIPPQPINNLMNNYKYLNLPVTFEIYDNFKPQHLSHPYSRDQGNAVYPGAPEGKYKHYTGKILTLNDLIRNKKKYSNNIYKDVKIKGN